MKALRIREPIRISSFEFFRYDLKKGTKGAAHEPSSRSRRHPQRRIHPHLRCQTPAMGRRRPPFGGWEIYHVKGSAVDPNRIYASQSSSWFGQIIQRSSDGGKTWETPAVESESRPRECPKVKATSSSTKESPARTVVRRHAHPWEFKRVWHLEPSLERSRYRLCRRRGRGHLPLLRWRTKLERTLRLAQARHGASLAAGCWWNVSAHDSAGPEKSRSHVHRHLRGRSISHDDAGKTWKPINRGLRSEFMPNPTAEMGHCVHRIAMHPSTGRSVHAETLGRHANRTSSCTSPKRSTTFGSASSSTAMPLRGSS